MSDATVFAARGRTWRRLRRNPMMTLALGVLMLIGCPSWYTDDEKKHVADE